jgi:DNA-binding MarR family transcriptional regulator
MSGMIRTATPTLSDPPRKTVPGWSFLTNYTLVLIYIVLNPDSTVRTIAQGVGITERATLALLRDLDLDGIIARRRDGRRNTYSVNFEQLAHGRRGGGMGGALTPRPFVDVVVRTLFSLADESGGEHLPPPKLPVHEHKLRERQGSWGFFTNQMLMLLALATDHRRTVRELAVSVGITERAGLGVISQLESEGIITRTREGRRTKYTIDFERFRSFRGWKFETWSIPQQLIDVATGGLRALAASRDA